MVRWFSGSCWCHRGYDRNASLTTTSFSDDEIGQKSYQELMNARVLEQMPYLLELAVLWACRIQVLEISISWEGVVTILRSLGCIDTARYAICSVWPYPKCATGGVSVCVTMVHWYENQVSSWLRESVNHLCSLAFYRHQHPVFSRYFRACIRLWSVSCLHFDYEVFSIQQKLGK